MPRRLKYLILAICLLAATLSVLIFAGAAVRYNRAAGLFDAPHEVAEASRNANTCGPIPPSSMQ